MLKNVKKIASFVLFCCAIRAQGYRNHFEDPAPQFNRYGASGDGQPIVDPATGSMNQKIAIGPGIGLNGVSYVPTMAVTWAPKMGSFMYISKWWQKDGPILTPTPVWNVDTTTSPVKAGRGFFPAIPGYVTLMNNDNGSIIQMPDGNLVELGGFSGASSIDMLGVSNAAYLSETPQKIKDQTDKMMSRFGLNQYVPLLSSVTPGGLFVLLAEKSKQSDAVVCPMYYGNPSYAWYCDFPIRIPDIHSIKSCVYFENDHAYLFEHYSSNYSMTPIYEKCNASENPDSVSIFEGESIGSPLRMVGSNLEALIRSGRPIGDTLRPDHPGGFDLREISTNRFSGSTYALVRIAGPVLSDNVQNEIKFDIKEDGTGWVSKWYHDGKMDALSINLKLIKRIDFDLCPMDWEVEYRDASSGLVESYGISLQRFDKTISEGFAEYGCLIRGRMDTCFWLDNTPTSIKYPDSTTWAWEYGKFDGIYNNVNKFMPTAKALSKFKKPGFEEQYFWSGYSVYFSRFSDINSYYKIQDDMPGINWGVSKKVTKDLVTNVDRIVSWDRKLPIRLENPVFSDNINGVWAAYREWAPPGPFFDGVWSRREFVVDEYRADGSRIKYEFAPVPEARSAILGTDTLSFNPVNARAFAAYRQNKLIRKTIFGNYESSQAALLSETSVEDGFDFRSSMNANADPNFARGVDLISTRKLVYDHLNGVMSAISQEGWDVVGGAFLRSRYRVTPASKGQIPSPVFDPPTDSPWGTLGWQVEDLTEMTYADGRIYGLFGLLKTQQTTRVKDLSGFGVIGSGPLKTRLYDWEDGLPALGRVRRESISGDGKTLHTTFDYYNTGFKRNLPNKVTLAGPFRRDGEVGASYGYDDRGQLNSISLLGVAWSLGEDRDAFGRVRLQKDANGIATSYDYYPGGRIKAITKSGNAPVTFLYDHDGLQIHEINGTHEQKYQFDGFGQIYWHARKGISGWAHQVNRYDLAGRCEATTVWKVGEAASGVPSDQEILAKRTWYDYWGRPYLYKDANDLFNYVAYAERQETHRRFRGSGNAFDEGMRTALGEKSLYRDPLGRLCRILDEKNQDTSYTYTFDNKIQTVSQSGASGIQTRTWKYDGFRRLVELIQPESGSTIFSDFDVTGKPWCVSYNGRNINRTFDTIGRITSLNGDGSLAQNFLYDQQESGHGLSNSKLIVDVNNGIRRDLRYFDSAGRISALELRIPEQQPLVQTFEYDIYGNCILSTIDGRRVSSTFDLVTGLQKTVNYEGKQVALATYGGDPGCSLDPSWNLRQLGYAGGTTSYFEYDYDQTRIKSLTHVSSGARKDWHYQYDDGGRLKTDGEDVFGYDSLNRLTYASVNRLNGEGFVTQSFLYDSFGNMISSTPAGNTSGVNGFTFKASEPALLLNRMPGNSSTGAVYDPQGNLVQVFVTPGAAGDSRTMTYDALGRVTSLTDAKRGVQERYQYTADGLRTVSEEWKNGTFLRRKINLYNDARQLVSSYDTNGWKKDIVYVGTKEVAEFDRDGMHVTLTDHLGSPRLLVDGAGVLQAEQKFLPFGVQLAGLETPLKFAKGFTNHEQTDASGLIYMQARFYLPMYGRFASPDPKRDQHFEDAQSWNIYSYCRNMPTLATDPDGQEIRFENARDAKILGDAIIRSMPKDLRGGVSVVNSDGKYTLNVPTVEGAAGNYSKWAELSQMKDAGVNLHIPKPNETILPFGDGAKQLQTAASNLAGDSSGSGRTCMPMDIGGNPKNFNALLNDPSGSKYPMSEVAPGKHSGGFLNVIVLDFTYDGKSVPGKSIGKTANHEALGHALPFLLGQQYSHDFKRGSPFESNIKTIERESDRNYSQK